MRTSLRPTAVLGAFVLSLSTFLLLVAGTALGDVATGPSVSINGGAAATNSLNATVTVGANHCPPGGDMTALEIAFRNDPADAWTVVKASGAAWDPADPLGSGCTGGAGSDPSPATRDFAWTLAAGPAGARTVYVRFKHANDEVFGQDSIDYVVSAYTITGFYEPVRNRADDQSVVNGVKGGSTVPLKFNIWDGDTAVSDPLKVATLVQRASCDPSDGTDMLTSDELSAGSTSLRWDGEQFIFNWKTPKTRNICYRVTATAEGGASISADFVLK